MACLAAVGVETLTCPRHHTLLSGTRSVNYPHTSRWTGEPLLLPASGVSPASDSATATATFASQTFSAQATARDRFPNCLILPMRLWLSVRLLDFGSRRDHGANASCRVSGTLVRGPMEIKQLKARTIGESGHEHAARAPRSTAQVTRCPNAAKARCRASNQEKNGDLKR